MTRTCVLTLACWRTRSFLESGITLSRVTRRELVCTDASLSRWGAVYRGVAASGRWDHQWSLHHVNVLELRAVRLALQRFLPYCTWKAGTSWCGRNSLVPSPGSTVSMLSLRIVGTSCPGGCSCAVREGGFLLMSWTGSRPFPQGGLELFILVDGSLTDLVVHILE